LGRSVTPRSILAISLFFFVSWWSLPLSLPSLRSIVLMSKSQSPKFRVSIHDSQSAIRNKGYTTFRSLGR